MRYESVTRCRRSGIPFCLLGGLVSCILHANTARATPPSLSATSFETTTNEIITPLGFLNGISRSGYLFGDMWGLRPWLSKYGVSLAISETSEVMGNATGGVKQGVAYQGLTQMVLQMDTQRAFNWYGGLFNVSGLQIHGGNLSADNLYSLQTASGIEADRATRLWELWYQQKFLDEDRLDVKIGQQSLDQEFMVSQNALLFVNTMFGWPALPSYNMPGGGPAYPLSALGARLRVRPINSLTFLAGVFSGSPAPDTNPDPQKANPSGVSFPWNGSLLIAELQYSYPSVGSMVSDSGSGSLSGTYKIGAWYNTEHFADNGYNSTSEHDGNYAFYAVMDQMLWSDPNDPDSDRIISFFARAMGTPLQDRNLLDFSMNAGFTFHEPIRNRDDDTFGIGMGYVRVSDGIADADEDFNLNNPGSPIPVQSGETFVEVTYQYQLTPWCSLQPDFQYVFNPGGGLPNPNAPGQRIKDEAVFGLRANIIF